MNLITTMLGAFMSVPVVLVCHLAWIKKGMSLPCTLSSPVLFPLLQPPVNL